jgi:hypothetical protein
MKFLEFPFKLTKEISIILTTVFTFLAAVSWVAASETIRVIAPIIFWAFTTFALLTGVVTLVSFAEGDRVELENDQLRTQIRFQSRVMAASARQVERGLIHPAVLGSDAKFSSFPTQVIKQIENGAVPLLEAPQSASWPKKINLFDIVPTKKGDLNNIILGVNLDEETGKQTVIQSPLEDLVHCAFGGETGTGKSTLAYSVAYQIATSPQDANLVLADPAGTTWKTLSNCGELLYPIISSMSDCLYVLNELHKLSVHRTETLFAPYPTVEKLSEYNAAVGADDQLSYIAMFIDEFPEYMEDPKIETILKRLIRKSRKAGIYIFGMGTSWKHNDLDTSIKRQFRTKVHFAASDVDSSRVLLGANDAAGIKEVGRAFARLPFDLSSDLVEIQTPYIDKAEVYQHMSILDLPVSSLQKPTLAEQAVINAKNEGSGLKECYRIYHQIENNGEVPASVGGHQTKIIKDILQKWGVEGV